MGTVHSIFIKEQDTHQRSRASEYKTVSNNNDDFSL